MPIKTITVTEISNYRGAFLDFKGMALHGYADSQKADAKICFTLGMMCGVSKEESELLMEFLIEYWNAWTMDIIYGTYKYVNLTETVYSSWLGYKAKRG